MNMNSTQLFASLLVLLLLFSGAVAAHAGEEHSGQSGGKTVLSDLSGILSEIGIVNLWTGFLALVTIVVFVSLLFRSETEISRPVLALVGIALLVGFTGVYASQGAEHKANHEEHKEISETFGPGMGPLHMSHFYEEEFSPEQAKEV
ncbi:MAG: hypothetical protein ABEI52_08480, partial [Halobacteriaceae archaeon]